MMFALLCSIHYTMHPMLSHWMRETIDALSKGRTDIPLESIQSPVEILPYYSRSGSLKQFILKYKASGQAVRIKPNGEVDIL